VSGISKNRCPLCAGIAVRNQQESVSALRKNHCPEWPGISVRFGQEYAHYQKEKKSKVISIDTIITSTIPLIKLKYNDQQNKQIIRLLYETLAEDYLDDTYKQFERHFINNRLKFRKSIWKGKGPEIAHLFKYLKDKRFILSENQNKLIELHFLNKKDEEFKHRQLSVTLSKSNIEYYPKIHHLTEELKKLVLTFF